MDFKNLSKSSSAQVVIGDLGSDKSNVASATATFIVNGPESGILQFARERMKGKEILFDELKPLGNNRFEYTCRFKSENGI